MSRAPCAAASASAFRPAYQKQPASRPRPFPDPEIVAALPPDPKRFLPCGDRVVDRLREMALVSVGLEEAGSVDRHEVSAKRRARAVLRSGLAVRVEGRCPPGRGHRVLQYGRRVGSALRVVRQAGQGVRGRRSAGPEGLQRAPVKRQMPRGGQRLEDRVAGELVAEREALAVDAEHPGRDAVPHRWGIAARDLRQEPRLSVSPDHGGGVQGRPARLR